MVMTRVPQGERLNPRFTHEVCVGMSIADTIANMDALGGDRVLLLHPGTYDEGDITPNGGADITIQAMGEGEVIIQPTAAPVTAVIVSGNTLTLVGVTVNAFSLANPAITVNGGLLTLKDCDISGVGIGDAIAMVNGQVNAYRTTIHIGDIDLSTNDTILNMYFCRLVTDPIDTAGNLVHQIMLEQCDLSNQGIASAATGATTVRVDGCTHMGLLANAGTGNWECRDSDVGGVNFTGTGTLTLFGGDLGSVTRATASVVWWKDASTIKVLPCATTTDTMITYALASAAAVAPTRVEIRLAPGEYVEDQMACVDDCIIVGAGHTVASGSYIHINSANAIFTCGVAQMTIRQCRIIQEGAGNCLEVTNAAGILHLDDTVFGSGGQSLAMTAGTFSSHGATVTAGNLDLRTAQCTLTLHRCDISAAIMTQGAFAHVITLDDCDLNGNNFFNDATGATVIEIWASFNIGSFRTDGVAPGTVTIEKSVVTVATKLAGSTGVWTCRVADFGALSNLDATGAVTCFGGLIYGITRAVGPIVWWQDTNTLKVIPSGTITDSIIQWAVNAAGAGDTVLLSAGTYTETVTFDVATDVVTLRGDSRDKTIITMAAATVLYVHDVSNVCVENLTVELTAGAGHSAIDVYGEADDAHIITRNVTVNTYGTLATINNGIYTRQAAGNTGTCLLDECSIWVQNIGAGASTTRCLYFTGQGASTIRGLYVEANDFNGSAVACHTDQSVVHSQRCHFVTSSTNDMTVEVTDNAASAFYGNNDTYSTGIISKGAAGIMVCRRGTQEFDVWAGMEIQDAITYAAADIPPPAATTSYTVLIHPGIYDEVITCVSWVNLESVGPASSVIIYQLNADIITGADNVHLDNFTIRLGTPDAERHLIEDNAVACTMRMTNLILEITAPTDTANLMVFYFAGAGNYTIERCFFNITYTGDAVGHGVHTSTNAATLHLIDNDFTYLGNTAAIHLFSAIASTITGGGNRWAGTCHMFGVVNGTITLDKDAIVCTGSASGDVAGGTVVCRTGEHSFEVYEGMVILHAVAAGRYIYVHPGTYTLTATLAITVSNLTIQGAGRQTIITTATDHLDIITCIGGDTTELENIILRDFLVRGFETGNKNDIGIYWEYVDNSKIINVRSEHNGEEGFKLYWCDHCDFDELVGYSNTLLGIRVYTSTYCKFVGCTTDENTQDGIQLWDSPFCSLIGHIAYNNGFAGITLTSSDNCVIVGAITDDNESSGLRLFKSSRCTVTGGQFNNNGIDGIHIDGSDPNADFNTITGVVATGNAADGIEISEVAPGDANKNIILGCQLLGNGALALNDGGTNTEKAHNIVV